MLNSGDLSAAFPLLITECLTTCVYVRTGTPFIVGLLHTSQPHSFESIIAGPTCRDGCLRAAGHNGDIV